MLKKTGDKLVHTGQGHLLPLQRHKLRSAESVEVRPGKGIWVKLTSASEQWGAVYVGCMIEVAGAAG